VVVDSDLRSIVPEWIELLAGPILKGGYDFVAPLYAATSTTAPSPTPSPTGDASVVWPAHPPADRGRLRCERRPDPRLPRAGELDAGRVALRDRHLDDDDRPDRRIRGLPEPPRGQDPRSEGPGSDLGPMFRQVLGRSSAWPAAMPTAGWKSPAATTCRPTVSSATPSRPRSRSTRCGCSASSTPAR